MAYKIGKNVKLSTEKSTVYPYPDLNLKSKQVQIYA